MRLKPGQKPTLATILQFVRPLPFSPIRNCESLRKDTPYIAMRHRLSDAQKAFLSRPFSTSRLLEADASRGGHLAVLAVYLGLAAGLAVLVVAVRRGLRPPRSVLEDTFIDVSAGGVLRRRQHLVPCFWQVHRSAERNCDPLSGVPAGRRGRIRLTPPSRAGQAQRLTRARQRTR